MATIVKSALRTASAWTANQAAMEALYGVGNYYTTITAWEAALPADIVALDEQHVLECYNDWSAGLDDTIVLSGTTTDATRNLVIRPATGEGHTGVPNTGFRIVNTVYGAKGIKVYSRYTRIEGIELKMTASQSYGFWVQTEATLDGCICSQSHHGAFVGYYWYTNSGYPQFYNCIAINCSTTTGNYGAFGADTWHKWKAYNCAAINCGIGFNAQNGGPYAVRNTFTYGCTDSWKGGTFHSSCTNNATDDNATESPPGTTPLATDIVAADFVDAANYDFHLASGSQLIGQGAVQSEFTDDIDGDTRSAPWDIGIDQYVVSTTTATLSGTATASITEADITAGGKTIILTLTGDTWVASGTAFDAQRQAIIDGLVSAQSETDGWNNTRPNIPVTAVVRTSDTIVTITLPAL
jgi:hypothetical protein